MKNSIFIISAFCACTLSANAAVISNEDATHVSSATAPSEIKYMVFLQSPVDPRAKNKPVRRSPATNNLLPKAWIEGTSLMLHGIATIENLYYEVLDADDSPVLSGYVCVRKDAELSISLASLPSSASYTLQLTIGSDTYAAEFEL